MWWDAKSLTLLVLPLFLEAAHGDGAYFEMRAGAYIEASPRHSDGRLIGSDLTSVLIALGIFATVALRNWEPVMYAAQYLMVLAIFIHLAKMRLKFHAGMYVAFFGFFAVWCLFSTFWAHDIDRSLSGTIGVVQFVVVGGAIGAYVIVERSPEFLLNCLAWSVFGLVVVLVALTPLDVWLETMEPMIDASSDANRLGGTVGYHPNALGRVLSVGAFIWIYKLRSDRAHRLLKVLVVVALVSVLILTKSRLSIAIFVVLVFLHLLLTSPSLSRFMMRAILGTAALGLIFWAVVNIPVLYDTVGFRFMAMLGLEGTVDASTSTRADMVDVALDLFSRNPFLGVGFENYAYYYYHEYSGWAETYAHNNYAELLADLGLVGLISYYAVPLWVSYKLLRRLRIVGSDERMLVSFLFLLASSQLAADFAGISYTNDFVQLVTVLLFSWVILYTDESQDSPQNAFLRQEGPVLRNLKA